MSTVGSLLRSSQAYCQQLCEKETLRYGIAFYCPSRPELSEGNQFREVVIDEARSVPIAFEEAEAFFGGRGLRCDRWAPAMSQDPGAIDPFLAGHGFRRVDHSAWVLSRWPEVSVHQHVRVLPARAMRAALRATFEHGTATSTARASADACEARLDDPPFDMFVAMTEGRAGGRCALYQVGDFARVMDLTLLPGAEGAVAAALLGHVLTMARRLAMRTVVAELDEQAAGHASLFERFGFVRDATVVEFHRDARLSV